MPPPVEFYEKNFRASRIYEFYAATNVFSTVPYGTYPDRRIECLKDAAARKNNLFAEIAKMESGRWQDVDEKVVLQAVESVTARAAGSEILLCGLLGCAAATPRMNAFRRPCARRSRPVTLGFRYWSDEPGGDCMDFQSESRRILFHTCEILAGQLHPDSAFANAGKNGRWHREKGERSGAGMAAGAG